jgi:hypothetical protein
MVIYKDMVKQVLLLAVIVVLSVGACTSTTPAIPTEGPATGAVQETPLVPTSTSEPEQIELETPQPEDTQAFEVLEEECPGESTNLIGQGIAGGYEFTSYEEVMSWFCEGAEFEDILVALQTEDQISFPAEEMLVMLADGFSWEEIWMVVDLIE